jgi:hypothetical protein
VRFSRRREKARSGSWPAFRAARRARLAGMGMSTRAIAPVVGASQKTVDRDLRESDDSPEPRNVTGLDGKSYTAPAPADPDPEVVDAKIVETSSYDDVLVGRCRWQASLGRSHLRKRFACRSCGGRPHALSSTRGTHFRVRLLSIRRARSIALGETPSSSAASLRDDGTFKSSYDDLKERRSPPWVCSATSAAIIARWPKVRCRRCRFAEITNRHGSPSCVRKVGSIPASTQARRRLRPSRTSPSGGQVPAVSRARRPAGRGARRRLARRRPTGSRCPQRLPGRRAPMSSLAC